MYDVLCLFDCGIVLINLCVEVLILFVFKVMVNVNNFGLLFLFEVFVDFGVLVVYLLKCWNDF